MSVHQLRDGRWFVAYPKGTLPDDPKRTREFFGRGPQAEAQAHARNSYVRKKYGKRAPRDRRTSPTLAELADAYLDHKELPGPSAINFYYKMHGVILPALGHIQAIRLDRDALDKYVAQRRQSVKATTIHRELSDIQAVLNLSVEMEMLAFNPVSGYRKPQRDDARIRPPSADEIKEILKHATEHLKRSIVISYFSGLRPGRSELLNIRWADIDWSAETILVRSAQKGGPPLREVHLHDIFFCCLNEWYEVDRRIDPMPDHIIRWHGEPVKKLRRSWKSALTDAGITRRIRMYDIRHAHASNLIRAGADIKTVSEILGHSRPDTTARIYQHVTRKQRRDAINKLEW